MTSSSSDNDAVDDDDDDEPLLPTLPTLLEDNDILLLDDDDNSRCLVQIGFGSSSSPSRQRFDVIVPRSDIFNEWTHHQSPPPQPRAVSGYLDNIGFT